MKTKKEDLDIKKQQLFKELALTDKKVLDKYEYSKVFLDKKSDIKKYGYSDLTGFVKFMRKLFIIDEKAYQNLKNKKYSSNHCKKEKERLELLNDINKIDFIIAEMNWNSRWNSTFLPVYNYNYIFLKQTLFAFIKCLLLFQDINDFCNHFNILKREAVTYFPDLKLFYKTKKDFGIETSKVRTPKNQNTDNDVLFYSKSYYKKMLEEKIKSEEIFWNKKYYCCRNCKTKDKENRPHFANGYCRRCYFRSPKHRKVVIKFDKSKKSA